MVRTLYENANPISFILQRRYLEDRSVLPGCSCYVEPVPLRVSKNRVRRLARKSGTVHNVLYVDR